jgi:hypothetical protein
MRISLIAGLILVAAGIFMILRPIHYPTNRSVLKLGSLQASVQEDRTLPPWAGGVVLGAGVALLGAAIIKR